VPPHCPFGRLDEIDSSVVLTCGDAVIGTFHEQFRLLHEGGVMRRWDDGGTGKDRVTRQEAAATPEPALARRAPGRKNTRAWCKGKVGRPHTVQIVYPPNAFRRSCSWADYASWRTGEKTMRWCCHHGEVCTVCGKVLRVSHGWFGGDLELLECPDYVPGPPVHH
jgi:hypothetical protein